jgi:hypothetical protein
LKKLQLGITGLGLRPASRSCPRTYLVGVKLVVEETHIKQKVKHRDATFSLPILAWGR